MLAGTSATFSVTATGTSLSYQWQRSTDGGSSFADIPGAINATLTLTNVTINENGYYYRVVVSNSFSTVISDAATLTVNAAPAAPQFTTQPADVSVVVSNQATFSVVVTGNPTPTLKWQISTDGGTTWSDINGATLTSYTTPATLISDSGQKFRVVATNTESTINSNAATLTVTPAPSAPQFTSHPANASVTAPNTATFTVSVTGNPTPTLQWQISTNGGSTWGNINGATSTSYTTPATSSANNGQKFRAVATNSVKSVNSNEATLTVTADPAWAPTPPNTFADGNVNLDSIYVDFAMNDAGDAMAVYVRNDGTGTLDLMANRFTSGAWGTPHLIDTSSSPVLSSRDGVDEGPRVAINANGSAVAVWRQNDGTVVTGIWAKSYTVAGGWGTTQMIDTADPVAYHDSVAPEVGIDSSGNAIAVWHKWDGTTMNIWANQMSSSGNWSGPFKLENDDTATYRAIYPSIAMNDAGNAVVAWTWADSGGTRGPLGARYYDGTNWGTVQNIAPAPALTYTGCRVGIGADGKAVAVWAELDGAIMRIMSSHYSGVVWQTPVNVSDISATTHVSSDLDIAMNANGSVVAVWKHQDLPYTNVYANRFVPGSGWGTAALIEGFNNPPAISPQAAIDPNGNSFALMGRITSDSWSYVGRLRANRAPVGGAWGTDTAVDWVSYPGAPSSWRIRADGSGRAMALWLQEGPVGQAKRVYYRRYQ